MGRGSDGSGIFRFNCHLSSFRALISSPRTHKSTLQIQNSQTFFNKFSPPQIGLAHWLRDTVLSLREFDDVDGGLEADSVPDGHIQRLRAFIRATQGCSPHLSRVTHQLHKLTSFRQFLLHFLLHRLLGEAVHGEWLLGATYGGHVEGHADVAGGAEAAGVQEAVAVDEEDLGPEGGAVFFEAGEQRHVGWHLPEGQEAWNVGHGQLGFGFEVAVDHFHGGTLANHQASHTLLLIFFEK